MARSRIIYTLKEVAGMIGENLELIEEVTANSDNISEGELLYVRDGSEHGTKGLTENGVDELQNLLAEYGHGMVESASFSSMSNLIRMWSNALWQTR